MQNYMALRLLAGDDKFTGTFYRPETRYSFFYDFFARQSLDGQNTFRMVNENATFSASNVLPRRYIRLFLFNVIPHSWHINPFSVTAAMLCKYSQYASPVKYNRLFGRKHRDATGGWIRFALLSGRYILINEKTQLCKLRITTLGR